ncbi:MAG: hypothetical protein Q9160_003563 [Pyrenula sp. 1 TL-2023]
MPAVHPSTDLPSISFIDLPAEIRVRIYELSLDPRRIMPGLTRACPPATLLQASKQIYHEAVPILYQTVRTGKSWTRFSTIPLHMRDQYAISCIRSAEIHVDPPNAHLQRPRTISEPSSFIRYCPELQNLTIITGLGRKCVPRKILTTLLMTPDEHWPHASITVTAIRRSRLAMNTYQNEPPRTADDFACAYLPMSTSLRSVRLVVWVSEKELKGLLGRRVGRKGFVKIGERLERSPRDPFRLGEVDLLWTDVRSRAEGEPEISTGPEMETVPSMVTELETATQLKMAIKTKMATDP